MKNDETIIVFRLLEAKKVNHGPFRNVENSHCSTDSTDVDLASDRVNWDVDHFDAEILAGLVKGSMS
jgi:hypothetical protein